MLWTGHLTGFIVILFGLWWLSVNISDLPDYKLIAALAAVTGLILNHFRWWRLGKKLENLEIFDNVNYLVVTNYLVFLLLFVLLDLRM